MNGPALHLRLLGHLTVADTKGRTFLPVNRKTRAMVAVLAMSSPRPVLRVHLASLLWSRRDHEQARASLRQSVHELQTVLGPDWAHVFTAERHHLVLRGPDLDIDTAILTACTRPAAAALDRFKEVLLEDLDGLDPAFDQWLGDARARVTRLARTFGENVLAVCSDPADSIDIAERLLAIDPRHEGAFRALMRGYAERGDAAAAIGAYDRCRAVLADIPGARPSPETQELLARIRSASGNDMASPRLPPDLPARRGGVPPQSNLRLRIAPFRSIGGDADAGLAAGLVEEVTAGLSRFRWITCLPVMAWPLAVSGDAAGRAPDGPEADLMLDGTIQHGGGEAGTRRVRIIVRLVDLRAGGEIVWAGRFDRAFCDILALQDELATSIVGQIDPELLRHEGRRSAGAETRDMTSQELLLRALPGIYRLERDGFVEAGRLLEESLRADAGNSVAHGWLAYWNLLYVGQGWSEDPAAAIAEAGRLAERAVTLDPGDARALTLAGHVRGFLSKHPEEAIALHDRAIALNPNLALAWCFSGFSYSYLGRHDEALRRINQAIRLSPSDSHSFFFDMALVIVQLMRGDYAGAVEAGRRAIELNPLFSSTYKSYLSALGWLGRIREADEVRERLLTLEPGFTVRDAMERSPFLRPEDVARYAEGLRRAGLPEGMTEGAGGGRESVDLGD